MSNLTKEIKQTYTKAQVKRAIIFLLEIFPWEERKGVLQDIIEMYDAEIKVFGEVK